MSESRQKPFTSGGHSGAKYIHMQRYNFTREKGGLRSEDTGEAGTIDDIHTKNFRKRWIIRKGIVVDVVS